MVRAVLWILLWTLIAFSSVCACIGIGLLVDAYIPFGQSRVQCRDDLICYLSVAFIIGIITVMTVVVVCLVLFLIIMDIYQFMIGRL
jgi:hypothetical protein